MEGFGRLSDSRKYNRADAGRATRILDNMEEVMDKAYMDIVGFGIAVEYIEMKYKEGKAAIEKERRSLEHKESSAKNEPPGEKKDSPSPEDYCKEEANGEEDSEFRDEFEGKTDPDNEPQETDDPDCAGEDETD